MGGNQTFYDYLHKLEYNYLIDSGAYTAWKSGKVIELQDYIDWNKSTGWENYIMLDVLEDEEASKRNYEEMVKQGLRPMYVMSKFDTDFDYMETTLKVNPYVCMGGLYSSSKEWVMKKTTEAHNRGAKIHALGYVRTPEMYQCPVYSVDSSSWIQAPAAYGLMCWFEGRKISNRGTRDMMRGKFKPAPGLLKAFHKCGIRREHFKDENLKGKANLCILLAVNAYMEYMEYAQNRGVVLYLAASNKLAVKYIELYQAGINKYEEWKKEL